MGINSKVKGKVSFKCISSFTLHIIAMLIMLCDHLWGTILSQYDWLTWIGRIAFPIFAFLTVEGAMHTSNRKKYLKRMLVFALISEIPINLMMGGSVIYPFHQNVLWTLIIGLLCIFAIEKLRAKTDYKCWWKVLLSLMKFLGIIILGYVIAIVTFVDYNCYGILMIMVFYVFRGNRWWQMLGQLAGLIWVNLVLMGGFMVPVDIAGRTFEISQQGMAVFAIIPIWLYNGKRGLHNKFIQYLFYAFYPIHMLILALLNMYVF